MNKLLDILSAIVLPAIPILLIWLMVSWCTGGDRKEKRYNDGRSSSSYERMYHIQGDSSRYVLCGSMIYPCGSLPSQKDSISSDELDELPFYIMPFFLTDTINIRCRHEVYLREAALVYSSLDKRDTLDFSYCEFDSYTVKASDTFMTWDDIVSVAFLVKVSKDSERMEFVLSKEEFQEHFDYLKPYLYLKKIKKNGI